MNKDVDPNRKVRRKRKLSYLTLNKIQHVDYKEIAILRRFINDRGKILPARQSGNTAGQQRMITQAIKRAREMALIPFVVTEVAAPTPRRSYGDGGESAPTIASGVPVNTVSDEQE
ncbi:MAG: 30S ribosomal protein S18 [Armatimonadota bacterium]